MTDNSFDLSGISVKSFDSLTKFASDICKQQLDNFLAPHIEKRDRKPLGKSERSAKNNRIKYEERLENKCWENIADTMLPQTRPIKGLERKKKRGVIANLLRESDEYGVPLNVIDAIISITHRRNTSNCALIKDDSQSHATEKKETNKNAQLDDLSSIKSFLNSSFPDEGKNIVLQLLVLVLDVSKAAWNDDSFQTFLEEDYVGEDRLNDIFLLITEICLQDVNSLTQDKKVTSLERMKSYQLSLGEHAKSQITSKQNKNERLPLCDIQLEQDNISTSRTHLLDKKGIESEQTRHNFEPQTGDKCTYLCSNEQLPVAQSGSKEIECSKSSSLTRGTTTEEEFPEVEVSNHADPIKKIPTQIYSDLKQALTPHPSEYEPNWTDDVVDHPAALVGDTVSTCISKGAKWIEKSLALSVVPAVNSSIEAAGTFAKKNISSEEKSPIDFPVDEATSLACSEKIKEATGKVRETAHTVRFGIRDISTRGINSVAKKFEENELGTQLCPDEETREFLAAGGKIGLATLGGAAIVAEALYETTKAVAQKGTQVTADVARHKYGDAAGRLVEDTGESTGNVLRTITHIMAVEGKVMTEAVAKNTGRVHIVGEVDETNPFRNAKCNEDAVSREDSIAESKTNLLVPMEQNLRTMMIKKLASLYGIDDAGELGKGTHE